MIAEVTGGGASAGAQKRYGIQEAEGSKERGSKRARVDDDESDDERSRRR
jgi:SNW domain-containing protein 1